MSFQSEEVSRVRRRQFFFALWPDPSTRKDLVRSTQNVVRLSGVRAVVAKNLHLTVVFLGEITERQLSAVRGVPPVPISSFMLTLDTLDFRRYPRMQGASRDICLVPRDVPPELILLERTLWDGLQKGGFEREKRLYCPHLTLGRRGRLVTEDVRPVEWFVSKLVLVESVPGPTGASYKVRHTWRLGD